MDNNVSVDMYHLLKLVSIVEPAGCNDIGKVLSWAALAKLTPSAAGGKLILDSYRAGINKGGGIFVAVAGNATDNGGCICVPN